MCVLPCFPVIQVLAGFFLISAAVHADSNTPPAPILFQPWYAGSAGVWASWLEPLQTFRRSQNVLLVLAPDTCHIICATGPKTANNKKGTNDKEVLCRIQYQYMIRSYDTYSKIMHEEKRNIPGGTGI